MFGKTALLRNLAAKAFCCTLRADSPDRRHDASSIHAFGLTTVPADRVVFLIDEAAVGEVAIESPPSALGLSVMGGRAVFADTSLQRPLLRC